MQRIIALLLVAASMSVQVAAQSNGSVWLGYGTQGAVLKLELSISNELVKGSVTGLYAEGGYELAGFSEKNISYESVNYPSDIRVLYAGLGLSQEFRGKSFFVAPFAGARLINARFRDRALVEAIGKEGLIRYWNGEQVGPEIKKGYGYAISIDAGLRLGARLSKSVSLFASGGYAPLKFSTAATLFGRYWGESPYPNDYYIEINPWRAEGGLRIGF